MLQTKNVQIKENDFDTYESSLEAVKNNGFAIIGVPEKFIDKEMALIAVRQYGNDYKYLPEHLKEDEEIKDTVLKNIEYPCLAKPYTTEIYDTTYMFLLLPAVLLAACLAVLINHIPIYQALTLAYITYGLVMVESLISLVIRKVRNKHNESQNRNNQFLESFTNLSKKSAKDSATVFEDFLTEVEKSTVGSSDAN